MELWTVMPSSPLHVVERAKQYESAGISGMVVWDAQSSDGDCYVGLGAAAMATSILKLGTGVTNPVTRHPAVTASAIASLQAISNGRAVLGIGRGDAALAHIGRAPASPATLSNYVQIVQRYLRGEEVPFAMIKDFANNTKNLEAVDVAHVPESSKLEWIGGFPKVPVEVSATGPVVIADAAIHADGVMLSVGADHRRLLWGIDLIRAARKAAGLDPFAIQIGAWINVVAHPKTEIAHSLASAWSAVFARFAVMHGESTGPLSDEDKHALNQLQQNFDLRDQASSNSDQAQIMSTQFLDQYAIAGTPEHCIARLKAVRDVGIDKIIAVGFSDTGNTPEGDIADYEFLSTVVPALAD